MINTSRSCIYEFERFRLDAAKRLLLCDGEPVALTPKLFDTLLVLVENRERVVDKDELMTKVWGEAVVEEGGIKRNVSMLRKALGENLAEHRYIVTVPGRGYQFVAGVNEWQEDDPALIVEEQAFSQIVIEEDEPEDEAVPASPASIDLHGALAKSPRALPASSWYFSITFRQRLVIGGVLVALATLVPLGLLYWRQPPTRAGQVRSLAVLPFQFLNSANDEESLGLGLADALITRLGATGVIDVRATSAVQQYTAAGRNPLEIGRKLEVEAVLDGRVQRTGDQLRLTVQLLRASDGAPLWAGSFDEHFTNLLAVQKTISEQAAQALTVKLTAEQQRRLKKDYTGNTAAFEAYVRGRYFWGKQTRESLAKGIGYYQQAIEIDPAYALAYAGVAECHISLAVPIFMMGIAPEAEFVNKARAAAQRAVELDESLPEAHLMLGLIFFLMGDAAAHGEFERALELNPNLAQAHNYYGTILFSQGRHEEGLAKVQRARELDPLSAFINTNLSMGLHRLRRYDEAIAQLQKTLEMDPNFVRAHWGLGLIYEQLGRYEEAIAEFQKAEQLSNGGSVPLSALAHVYAIIGRRAEAERILARLLALHEQKLASPYYIAAVYTGLGDKDRAFAWLEKIRGTQVVIRIKRDQYFEPLRDDPRVECLLPRPNLKQ